MRTDPLSDVLDLADARCVLTGTLLAGGGWARRFKRSDAVKFLAVVRGSCWLSTEGDTAAPARFEAGDVVTTGTPPGVALGQKPTPTFLKVGDVMQLHIQRLGEQKSKIVEFKA